MVEVFDVFVMGFMMVLSEIRDLSQLSLPTEVLLTPKAAGCFFLQPTGLTRSKRLPVWRAASVRFDPPDLPAGSAQAGPADGPGPGPQVERAVARGAASSLDSLKLASRQSLSLFTAFTLVQLRSLLRSKC